MKQIAFNAWHYADADLLVSLVTHVFEDLAVPSNRDSGRLSAAERTAAEMRFASRLQFRRLEQDRLESELAQPR